MNRFTQSTPQVQLPQPSSYAEKSFLHTTGAAVVVPFWQSVIISIAIGLVVFVLSLRFGSILIDAAMNAATVTVVMFVLSFVYLLRHWFALTIEKALNIDIPGLGMEPEKPAPIHYTVNTFNREGHMTGQSQYTFKSVTEEQISAFCHKTRKMGFPISRRKWEETGIIPGDTYRTFYGELVKQGLVGVQQGRNALTEAGENWADGVIAEDDPHYSPADEAAADSGNQRGNTHPPTPHPGKTG
jgi:uncharacterized membrane protein YhaH (DUF805 family)